MNYKTKTINKSLLISLIIFYFLPTISETLRIIFLNLQDNGDMVNIASQIEWFDLINEILQAFLLIPVYCILNKMNDKELKQRIFKFGILLFSIYFLFSIFVYFNINSMSSYMSTSNVQTIVYLKLETIGFICGILFSYFLTIFIIIDKAFNVLMLVIFKTSLIFVANISLIMACGTNGIAYSNIVINVLMTVIAAIMLWIKGYIKVSKFTKQDIKWICSWIKTGFFSGSQVFIDNFVYAVMICKMVNEVSQQANYWMVNNFIWGFLLLPFTGLGEIIKQKCKDKSILKEKWPYTYTLVILVLIILTIPLWSIYFSNVVNTSNVNELLRILFTLAPFYIFYVLSNVIDSEFYGLGITHLPFINSLIVNLVYYGIIFVLFKFGLFTLSINFVICMFGGGMIVHWLVNICLVKALDIIDRRSLNKRLAPSE